MTTPSVHQKMTYLTEMYKIYLNHLNAIFNFFIVFSGLVVSGIALIVREDLNKTTYVDETFLVLGIIFTLIIVGIDDRDRSFIGHLETQMSVLENKYFGEGKDAYLNGAPKARWGFVKNGVMFRIAFFTQIAFLASLLCLL